MLKFFYCRAWGIPPNETKPNIWRSVSISILNDPLVSTVDWLQTIFLDKSKFSDKHKQVFWLYIVLWFRDLLQWDFHCSMPLEWKAGSSFKYEHPKWGMDVLHSLLGTKEWRPLPRKWHSLKIWPPIWRIWWIFVWLAASGQETGLPCPKIVSAPKDWVVCWVTEQEYFFNLFWAMNAITICLN